MTKDQAEENYNKKLQGVVEELSSAECRKISGRVIRALQLKTEPIQVGGHYGFENRSETGLRNLWDEICVQLIEAEYSPFWEYFELEVIRLVEAEVGRLPSYVQKAIWLQTEESSNQDQSDVIYFDAVYEYIAKEYVYKAARNWKNIRIMRYLHGEYASLYY